MAVDDVVIVKDDSLPRNRWPLARVVQTYPSDDGLVRKVKVLVADPSLDKDGRRSKASVLLERPVQKLVLFIPCTEAWEKTGGPRRGARSGEWRKDEPMNIELCF